MNIPVSLYIHFPWCIQKCPYCDFNSHQANQMNEKNYLARLKTDFLASLSVFQNRPIHSIFMGGGTPSLFSAEGIAEILMIVRDHIPLVEHAEITLEANPGTVDESRFKDFRQAGVNRLSLGVQSFHPTHLKKLGRIHDAEGAMRAIGALKSAGFTEFNLDLMHGLPYQTEAEALSDLETALSFNPPHLSWYQLTIEPNTVFYKNPPRLPPDDTLANIQEAGEKLLQRAGFQHYEISAFAKPNHQSQHNLNYWLFGDYLGIGAGAHSKLSHIENNQIVIERQWRTRQPKDYLDVNKNLIAGKNIVTVQELPAEFMMNTMRLEQSIHRELFEERTGLDWSLCLPKLRIAHAKKLLVFDENTFQLTALGRRFLNDVIGLFLI